MFATVYLTRSKGVRLPTPSRPVAGLLQLASRGDGGNLELSAKLAAESGDSLLLPELLGAQVLKISGSGIVITGTEVIPRRGNNKSSAHYYRQTWWCLIHTVAIAEALDILSPDEHAFSRIQQAVQWPRS